MTRHEPLTPPRERGADQRDAVGPNPLQAETPNSSPTLPQSSGWGAFSSERGLQHEPLPWASVSRAKRLMRGQGLDLYAAAHVLGVRPRDLDLALWNNLPEPR
jgi:hypothetical protein